MNLKNLTICLTLSVLLGSTGTSWGGDYEKGLAAAQSGDFATALKEWMPLAEQGDFRAQYNLGQMYRDGQGVPQDYKTAMKWYSLAAEQGDGDAQINLGFMYGNGQGVPQDNVYAHMWGNIAASHGNEKGGKLRDFAAKIMTATQIEKAQELAQECVAKKYKGC
jgi:hypothetical protein